MAASPLADERRELAVTLQAGLLAQLTSTRATLGLTQAELAERVGCNRMTVVRAESEGAGVSLKTFVEMAVGLTLTPRLVADQGQHDPDVVQALPADIVHRGAHHNRTKHDLGWRDRQREAALAKSWEAVNEVKSVGLTPIMETLVPNHTQQQASAVATAVQWLGSEVGFDFLTRALKQAGYEVVDLKSKR